MASLSSFISSFYVCEWNVTIFLWVYIRLTENQHFFQKYKYYFCLSMIEERWEKTIDVLLGLFSYHITELSILYGKLACLKKNEAGIKYLFLKCSKCQWKILILLIHYRNCAIINSYAKWKLPRWTSPTWIPIWRVPEFWMEVYVHKSFLFRYEMNLMFFSFQMQRREPCRLTFIIGELTFMAFE